MKHEGVEMVEDVIKEAFVDSCWVKGTKQRIVEMALWEAEAGSW